MRSFLEPARSVPTKVPTAYPAIPREGRVIRYSFSFNKCTLGSMRNYMKPFGDIFQYILIYPSKKLSQDALYCFLCRLNQDALYYFSFATV